MILNIRILLLTLLFAPTLGFSQSVSASLSRSLTVQGPFDAATYKPLSGHERWQRWVDEDGRSPAIYVKSLASASYSQVINSPSAWNRTTDGFLRRTGSSYATSLVQNSMHESLAAAEGTDLRYFPCACTGLFHRGSHALKMTFLTYSRNGHETLDIPQLSGAYGSSMIKTMWYPHHYSPLAQGVQSGHIEIGIIGAEHLAQEFAPELKRFFHLRFGQAAATP